MSFQASSPAETPDLSAASPVLLHHLFEQQAALTPAATAIEYGSARLTYGDLEVRSNRVARWLTAPSVGRGTCVAILLPRGPEMIVATLAVLKAGAAYVPLDPEYPADRIAFILEDSAAAALLTCRELAAKAAGFRGRTVLLENTEEALLAAGTAPSPPSRTLSEDLCYVIYTSGTTGRPKGVAIEHRSAVHLVRSECRLFEVGPADRVFQGFSIAFDASVEEIWLALATGATLVVGTAAVVRSGPSLGRWLGHAGITVLSCVPTLLAMMEDDVPCVRLLILGGEVCPAELVKRWAKPGRRIVNTYGPTETTVVATCAECLPGKPVTIGRPLPGYTVLIVNDDLELAAPGQAGELLIGGPGLARGYLGQPELTSQKFIHRVFGPGLTGRFYRTGDRARWNQDRELDFLGRIDSQVKIRGYRVELTEIEAVLLECEEIQAAAVVLHQDAEGPGRLAAFVVARSAAVLDLKSVWERLKKRLPAYMVPVAIDILPALPTFPSGKVNRKALPAPSGAGGSCRHIMPPRTSIESELARSWSVLFSVPSVSINDDFFLDLGGHSLLAARMVSALRRRPGFESLSMEDVYLHPVLAQLAQELEARLTLPKPKALADATNREIQDCPAPGPKEHVGRPLADTGTQTATEPAASSPLNQLVPFWRHFLCGLGQLLSLVWVLNFFALQWLAPYLTYTVLVEEEYDFVTAVLLALASLVVVYPLMLILTISCKWLLIGRYKPGRYPLWGWNYFRFWLVRAVEATVPVSYLSGTPLLCIYLRLMGARVGPNVFLQTDKFAIYDLLSLGAGSSINAEASLLGYSVSDGFLTIGRIDLGKRCFVGARAALGENTSMADDSALEDLSLLPAGGAVGSGEKWYGSPARQHLREPCSSAAEVPPAPMASRTIVRIWFGLGHALGLLLFPVLVVGALFPGIVLMNHLNYLDPYYWYLLLSPLVAVSFVVLLCLEIAGLKWLLLGRVRAGRYSLQSVYYLKKWFVDKTMELSLDVLGPLYASVYLTPWYKLLGATLGQGVEISTASFISPDLLSVGDESFIADNVMLGAPRVRDGSFTLGPNRVGRRSFIGNSAMLPPGTVIGNEVLIGCLSSPPQRAEDALRHDSAWLGSPALFLPQRLKNPAFGEEQTFSPPARLRALRAAIEFLRVVAPSTGFIILTSLLFSSLLLLHDHFSLSETLLFFPALYLGCGFAAAGVTILAKWMCVGRYRPGERPLWSMFVWRNELINALHEHLAGPFLVDALSGTPFLAWYLRLLGARIGRRTYLETTDFSEFDLVRIGDEAALNLDCIIQTHLFEDRVMKMSRLQIEPQCSVGAGSLVLYDAQMERGSRLGPLSLLMKAEVLPAGTDWAGIPARAGQVAGRQSRL